MLRSHCRKRANCRDDRRRCGSRAEQNKYRAFTDPILGNGNGSTLNVARWNARTNLSADSWALAWELLVGYKHFVNDYIGFRYYANVGVQHYESTMLSQTTGSKKQLDIGIIDYTLNMDMLFDFFSSESIAFGILGGVGFGGSSFANHAVNRYLDMYNATEIPIGASDITKHFFNINASVGLRLTFFQKSATRGGIRVCDSFAQGRRSCGTAANYIGHSLEFNAKFPLLEYAATDYDIMLSTDKTQFVSRPGYKIKNPYRFTFRYIIDF